MLHPERRGWRALPWTGLVSGAVLSLVYLYFFAMQAHVDFNIKMFEPKRAWFKIYWADDGDAFTEQNMREVLIDSKKENYQMFIGNLGNISKLRIDPVEFRTKLFLRNFNISQQGFATITLNPSNRFEGLRAVKEIDGVIAKEDGLRFLTVGRDGQFELDIDSAAKRQFPWAHIVIVLGIMMATLIATRVLGFLSPTLGYVPVLLLIAVLLSLIMAVISRDYWLHPNGTARIFVHPDEEAHSEAIRHYRDHLLPPAIDDPAIAPSYSVYGYTRLASYELYYPIAGLFTRLLAPLKKTFMWDARLFSVVLFALMAWLAWRQVPFRPLAMPLLLSSQIWYLYSYSNSDSFALVLATLAGWQAVWPESALSRLLSEQRPKRMWWLVAGLGLLAGALFLLKLNFYFFILFLGMYLLWKLICGDYPDQKRFWMRLILVGIVGLGVYGARYAVDIAVNGVDSKQKYQAMIEKMAKEHYKPSAALNRKHIYLYMRDRGVSLKRMVKREKWFGKAYISSFGAYGYTQYLGGPVYYKLVKVVGVAALAVLLFGVLIHGPPRLHWLFTMTIGTALLLVGASFWQSWTISFQAQGRYFAPILPMLGMLYYHVWPALRGRLLGNLLNGLWLAMFALGVYSFIFIGLGQIPKFA